LPQSKEKKKRECHLLNLSLHACKRFYRKGTPFPEKEGWTPERPTKQNKILKYQYCKPMCLHTDKNFTHSYFFIKSQDGHPYHVMTTTDPTQSMTIPTRYCGKVLGLDIEHDGALEDAAAQLEQAVEGEGGHTRLGPLVAAFFHVLLKLDPASSLFPLHAGANTRQRTKPDKTIQTNVDLPTSHY